MMVLILRSGIHAYDLPLSSSQSERLNVLVRSKLRLNHVITHRRDYVLHLHYGCRGIFAACPLLICLAPDL